MPKDDGNVKVDMRMYTEMPRDETGDVIREGMGLNEDGTLGGKNNGPGYALRTRHLQPRRGIEEPWLPLMDYLPDRELLTNRELDDGILEFSASALGTQASL